MAESLKKDQDTKRISFTCSAEDFEAIKSHCESENTDMSKMARSLFLEDINDKKKAEESGSVDAIVQRIRKIRERMKLINDDRMKNLPIDDLLDKIIDYGK